MDNSVFSREGPQILQDGQQPSIRLSKSAEVVVSQLHGKYRENASRRGNVFTSATRVGMSILNSANLGTTPTLFNPIGSGVYVALIRWDFSLTAAAVTPVIGAYVLAGNRNVAAPVSQSTPGVNTPMVSEGVVGRFATPAAILTITPIYISITLSVYRPFVNHLTGAITTTPNMPGFFMEFDGTCLLAPGCSLGVYQINSDATNALAIHSVVWEEISI